jgi:hypothetical protein
MRNVPVSVCALVTRQVPVPVSGGKSLSPCLTGDQTSPCPRVWVTRQVPVPVSDW